MNRQNVETRKGESKLGGLEAEQKQDTSLSNKKTLKTNGKIKSAFQEGLCLWLKEEAMCTDQLRVTYGSTFWPPPLVATVEEMRSKLAAIMAGEEPDPSLRSRRERQIWKAYYRAKFAITVSTFIFKQSLKVQIDLNVSL